MTFSTPYLFDPALPVCSEPVQTEPSMTVPDQSLTVSQLLDRYTRGLAPPIAHDPLYDDREDLDFDDVNPAERPDFDLSDLTEHRLRMESLSNQVQDEIRSKSKKKKEEEQPPPPAVPASETSET
jgi:hypothetical protein